MDVTMQYAEIDVEKEFRNFPLHAVFSRVYVKEFEVERAGRLLIPESAREGTLQTNLGVVLATGPEVSVVHTLDTIYYARHSGAYIKFEGVKYRVMNEDDILGIVKRKDERGEQNG